MRSSELYRVRPTGAGCMRRQGAAESLRLEEETIRGQHTMNVTFLCTIPTGKDESCLRCMLRMTTDIMPAHVQKDMRERNYFLV